MLIKRVAHDSPIQIISTEAKLTRNPSHIFREEKLAKIIYVAQRSLNIFHLWKIKDLAMSLSEILLLFEVNLKRPFNRHKRNATLREKDGNMIRMTTHAFITTFSEVRSYQNGPLKVGVDTAEHEFAHDGGDGGEHEGSA